MEEMDLEESGHAIVELLGVDGNRDDVELHPAHGVKVRLSWLQDIYVEHYKE